MHSRKTLLFANGEEWVKSKGDPNFDVTMGSYDGAELCELVGIYILHELGKTYGLEISGLYRDDGLQCNRITSGRILERMKKDIIKLFKDKFGLRITIETNLKIVNFLDVTLDLNTGTFKPFSKPNSQPIYIHVDSNHPPKIIERIPKMISDRISGISSSKEIFERAAPFYDNALQQSGHKSKLSYTTSKPNNTKRNRKRKITWFNPPYSANVKTNVAKKFLKLVEKNFPKKHRLSKLFNRNNLKVSYSCLPNIANIISSHNKSILTSKPPDKSKTCNCRNKDSCPLKGNCLQEQVIYQCTITSSESKEEAKYIGLTENSFKTRWNQHNFTFRHEDEANSTELSKQIWNLQTQDIQPILSHGK